jgi:hypothetical protein
VVDVYVGRLVTRRNLGGVRFEVTSARNEYRFGW